MISNHITNQLNITMAISKKVFRDIDLQGNEIQDITIENLTSDPSSALSGRLYYNNTDNKLKYYNGTSFIELGSSGSGGSGGSDVIVSAASFNTSDGILTLTKSDSSTVTVDLDGKYQDIITNTTNLNINQLTTGDISTKNIELLSDDSYYIKNNANIFHGINFSDESPTSTATKYYAVFDDYPIINNDLYDYVTPTSSSNTGIKLLNSGKYKVSYTLNWYNTTYNNRVNFQSKLVKHSSAITPSETELLGSTSYGYSRHDNYQKYTTTVCITIIDVAANEYIKCRTILAKNSDTFNNNYAGVAYAQNSSIVIEFLGNI